VYMSTYFILNIVSKMYTCLCENMRYSRQVVVDISCSNVNDSLKI